MGTCRGTGLAAQRGPSRCRLRRGLFGPGGEGGGELSLDFAYKTRKSSSIHRDEEMNSTHCLPAHGSERRTPGNEQAITSETEKGGGEVEVSFELIRSSADLISGLVRVLGRPLCSAEQHELVERREGVQRRVATLAV